LTDSEACVRTELDIVTMKKRTCEPRECVGGCLGRLHDWMRWVRYSYSCGELYLGRGRG
jgi:hypothetical protein